MEVYKKPLFNVSEIPPIINGVSLSEKDIDRLCYGESSGLLQNLMFGEGEIRDGKVWLSRDESGELEVNYLFSKPEIVIPKQLEDYIIPEKDRLKLMNNETVGPFLFGGQHIFLQVDHDINRIVVKSGYEINVPKKIAGYSLNGEDMNTLANGGKMKNRLFCIDGKYYTAEIGMTEDKRGLFFDQYKDQSHLSSKQLKELERTLNQPSSPTPPLELSPSLEEKRLLKQQGFAKYLLNPADDQHPIEKMLEKQREIFKNAVDNYDMNMIVHLKESGFIPNESEIDYLKNNVNLDNEEKRAIGAVLEVNLKEVTYDEHNRADHVSHTWQIVHIDEKTLDKGAELQKQQPNQTENVEKKHLKDSGASVKLEPTKKENQQTNESAVAQRVGNMVTEAFSGM